MLGSTCMNPSICRVLAVVFLIFGFRVFGNPLPPPQFTPYSTNVFGAAEVGDLNGDGLMDLFAVYYSRIFWNTGTNFSPAGSQIESSTYLYGMPGRLGDFDGDNTVDIYNWWPRFVGGRHV